MSQASDCCRKNRHARISTHLDCFDSTDLDENTTCVEKKFRHLLSSRYVPIY